MRRWAKDQPYLSQGGLDFLADHPSNTLYLSGFESLTSDTNTSAAFQQHSIVCRTVYVTSLKVYNRVRSKAATGVLWQKLFFKTSQYSQENTCAEKRLQHRYFLVNIAEFPRSPVLKYICDWLLISDVISTRLIQSNLAFAQPTLLKLLPIVLEQKYKTDLKNPQYLKI